jgi:hypothetical protein
MPRKQPFPPETYADPGMRAAPGAPRQSGPAPKGRRERPLPSTVPPPKHRKGGTKGADTKPSPTKAPDARGSAAQRRKGSKDGTAGATVDEVVADLSKDPRRERD